MKLLILSLFFIVLNLHSAFAEEKICDTVILHGEDEKIKLTETEELLVCGDPKNSSYSNIPPYQASYFLTGFLQARGYLNPKFTTIDGVLHVDTGEPNKLKSISVLPINDEKMRKKIKVKLKRYYLGEKLKTTLLNEMEEKAKRSLVENGYPCAKVKSMADIHKSLVEFTLLEGKYSYFGDVNKEKIKGLQDNALERYYPYHHDDPYNKKLLELNEKRLIRADVMQGTYYLNNCSDEMEELKLSQYFVLGPPRTLRYGVGASTELGPMLRFRWSNNRHKSMASILSTNLQASFRSQSINFTADSFFWKNRPRQSLFSQAEFVRDSQIDYEQSVFRIKPHMKWTQDRLAHFQQYTFGPTFETGTYSVKSNPNTKSFTTVAIEGGFQWTSHDYEYFNFHPQEGDTFGFGFDFRHPTLGFTDPLLKLSSTYAHLLELGYWGRGSLIGAIRLNAATTWVGKDVSLQSLPPSVKFYGGGSDDIRGFLLNTLPDNNGLGALTKLGMKLEIRRTNVFMESLEAFAFMDLSRFGYRSWETEDRLWYSPGAGLRWVSPIGMVQGYVSRGLVTNPGEDKGNFYYIGLGGTF